MPELSGLQDLRLGSRTRDLSPDSVFFTTGYSNFSFLSSASASVERCSLASDVPDQDSVAPVVSQHLAGHGLSEVLRGPSHDLNKSTLIHKNTIRLGGKEKNQVPKVDISEQEITEDESNTTIASARNSFSRALKECEHWKLRPDSLMKKSERRRPVSLDLNNPVNNVVYSSSPRFGITKKQPTAFCKTGTFLSPGTPNYGQPNARNPTGWSSERVPLRANTNRRNLNTSLLSYNNNGRTLPSKWEDAERWIFSPVLLGAGSGPQVQKRPKSKSGPLGPPGVAYYQMFSPVGPMLEVGGSSDAKLVVSSQFSSDTVGVSDSSGGCGGCEGGGGSFFVGNEPCMARSISLHACSELVGQSPMAVHRRDAKNDSARLENTANSVSCVVSRRDMATQMSPETSSIRSSSQRHSSSLSEAILPDAESHRKPDTRDVPIDERITMTRWSKESMGIKKNSRRRSRDNNDRKTKAMNFQSGAWEAIGVGTKSIFKSEREEAKITAWENLQKAKAEAAIRKLEMKLEKKRSSSTDKIMNKLRSAQKKAQQMRSSVLNNELGHHQPTRPALFSRRARPIRSLSGCFTCRAF